MFSFFTTNEANLALPDVIKKFENALAKRNEISKLEKEMQMSLSTTNSFEEYVNLKQNLNFAMTKFYESVEILENTGVPKGIIEIPGISWIFRDPRKRLFITKTISCKNI